MIKSIAGLSMIALFLSVSDVSFARTTTDPIKHIFEATLSGSEEVPPVQTSARGNFKATIPHGEGSFDYVVRANIKNVTAAHLHCGARGQNGPVVVPLFEGSARDVNGILSEGKINMSSLVEGAKNCNMRIDTVEHLIQAMRDGKIYINIHTTNYPNGEIRGQVFPTYDSTGYLPISTTTQSGGSVTDTTTEAVRTSIIAQLQSLLNQLRLLLAEAQSQLK